MEGGLRLRPECQHLQAGVELTQLFLQAGGEEESHAQAIIAAVCHRKPSACLGTPALPCPSGEPTRGLVMPPGRGLVL